ncbi:MAG: ABC transporter permease [Actinomycetota bacterium]
MIALLASTFALDVRRPQRMVERSLIYYRQGWLVLASGLFEPMFFLFSIRIGLSTLVGDVEVDGRAVAYDEFVAPGLLAAAAMNGAIFDATMNIYHKWKSARLYDSVLSTPLSAGDVAVGEILWAVVRGVFYSAAFLATMAAMGMVRSPWAIMALPAAALIAFTFAALGLAATTYMRGWADFEYVPAATLPLFLFSTTFFPASAYGPWSWVVNISPLYHGVELVRAANLGQWSWALVGHTAVLVGLTLFGTVVATRRFEKLLLS